MRESIENPLQKSRVFDLGKKEIYKRRRKTKTFGVFVNKYGGCTWVFVFDFYFFPTLELRQMNRAPTEYLLALLVSGKD